MKFQDLSIFDLNLIKSMAINLLSTTRLNCRYEALTDIVLSCIYAKGYIVHPYSDKLLIVVAKAIENKNNTSDQVIESIFEYLEKNNLEIKKDETRNPTWSNPSPSWYTPYNPRKGSWQW